MALSGTSNDGDGGYDEVVAGAAAEEQGGKEHERRQIPIWWFWWREEVNRHSQPNLQQTTIKKGEKEYTLEEEV